jgi:hypothetical protein
MRFLAAILCSLAAPSIAYADSVSSDVLFSKAYLGGVSCQSIGTTSSDYTMSSVENYTSPDISAKSPHPITILPTCTQGGGDCTCNVPYTEEKNIPSQPDRSFVRIYSDKNEPVWIIVANSDKQHFLDLATQGKTDIIFREKNPIIYNDQSLTKTIAIDNIYAAPQEIKDAAELYLKHHPLSKIAQDSDLFGLQQAIRPEPVPLRINGILYNKISIYLNVVTDDGTQEEYNEKLFFIRDIYVQSFDAQGRITFWTSTVGC